jgi:hypothetical protein
VDAARTELESRIARPNARPGSVKRASEALARLAAGGSVAIPARPEKTPEQVQAAQERAARKAAKSSVSPQSKAIREAVAARTASKGVVTQAQAFKLVQDLGRASGQSIPRWISAGARGRAIPVKG